MPDSSFFILHFSFFSQSSFFRIAVVLAVGNDKMVEEVEAHKLAGFLHPLGQAVVIAARAGVVARVVVA